MSLLIDIAQANVPGFHLAYGTTEKTIKAFPNALYAFLKATAEATVWPNKIRGWQKRRSPNTPTATM